MPVLYIRGSEDAQALFVGALSVGYLIVATPDLLALFFEREIDGALPEFQEITGGELFSNVLATIIPLLSFAVVLQGRWTKAVRSSVEREMINGGAKKEEVASVASKKTKKLKVAELLYLLASWAAGVVTLCAILGIGFDCGRFRTCHDPGCTLTELPFGIPLSYLLNDGDPISFSPTAEAVWGVQDNSGNYPAIGNLFWGTTLYGIQTTSQLDGWMWSRDDKGTASNQRRMMAPASSSHYRRGR